MDVDEEPDQEKQIEKLRLELETLAGGDFAMPPHKDPPFDRDNDLPKSPFE